MTVNRPLIWFSLALAFICAGCEKEETPVKLPPRDASSKLVSAEMGEKYLNQVYVNLRTGEKWNADNESWDLQLESSAQGYIVRMNGGKGVLVAGTQNRTFKDLTGYTPLYRWDGASGMKDSVVLSKWIDKEGRSYDSAYIIDRGSAASGQRFYQFILDSVNAAGYTIRIADLDGRNEKTFLLAKEQSKVNIYFSFAEGGKKLSIEPDKGLWDLCFLRYRWIYYEFDPPLLYQVTGVHINPAAISVAVDSLSDYTTVNLDFARKERFKDVRDIIGYDWKVPDFTATGVKYITRKYVTYMIRRKDNPEEIYKLRFVDFYNRQGVKGTPVFEYQLVD